MTSQGWKYSSLDKHRHYQMQVFELWVRSPGVRKEDLVYLLITYPTTFLPNLPPPLLPTLVHAVHRVKVMSCLLRTQQPRLANVFLITMSCVDWR